MDEIENLDLVFADKQSNNKHIELSNNLKKNIDKELAKFPKDQRLSAGLAALTYAQDEHDGYLTKPIIYAVAKYLEVPVIALEEVVSFYSMYEQKPVGKHKLCVCSSISCKLRGSDQITKHLKNKLKVGYGEVTKDGQFSIKHVECLGACIGAPVMQVGDTYYENLTCDKMDNILSDLSSSSDKK